MQRHSALLAASCQRREFGIEKSQVNWSRHYHLPKIIPIIVFTIFGLLLVSLFLHAGNGEPLAKRAMAKNDVTQLATAMIAFETEYGHLPGTGRQIAEGELLATLIGSNSKINPRNIAFIWFEEARKGRSGLTNGIFVDPWGGPYQIAFAEGTNPITAGTNGEIVHKRVAVWNEPSPDKNSWWGNSSAKRYVRSWD